MSLEVTRVTTDAQRKIAYALRFEVFIHEQKFDPEVQIDEFDDLPTTIHFLGRDRDSGKYVATTRCVIHPGEREATIGRVAVLRECRGRKFGAAMMHAVEHAVGGLCDRFVLMSQFDKKEFYEKCGYARIDDQFHVNEGVEHYWMAKRVAV